MNKPDERPVPEPVREVGTRARVKLRWPTSLRFKPTGRGQQARRLVAKAQDAFPETAQRNMPNRVKATVERRRRNKAARASRKRNR